MDPISLPPQFSQLSQNIATIEREADAKRAELEEAIAQAKEVQRTLSSLQRQVDDSADQLARADSQLAQFKAAADTFRASMLDGWGRGHVDGSSYAPPDYSHLVAFNSAIADFPRVRSVLAERLVAAQGKLREFERQHLPQSPKGRE